MATRIIIVYKGLSLPITMTASAVPAERWVRIYGRPVRLAG